MLGFRKMVVMIFVCISIVLTAGSISAQELDKKEFCNSVPGENWALVMDLSEFDIEKNQINKDGKGSRLLAYNKKTGMMISAFLTKEGETGDSKKCRDFYSERLKTTPIKMENMVRSERGEWALQEYFVKELQGRQVNSKHVNAYYAKGDTWIDVHMSKALFNPEDQKLFDAFLEKLAIKDNYQPTLKETAMFGIEFFTYGNYQNASEFLAKALEMEKREKQLINNKYVIRTVVEELGLSYLSIGNTEKALDTYEYGLLIDPEYAMYYYGKAYVYSRNDDMEKTLDNLKLAFKYKNSMMNGRKIPNPRTFSGFKKFFANPDFSKEVDLLMK